MYQRDTLDTLTHLDTVTHMSYTHCVFVCLSVCVCVRVCACMCGVCVLRVYIWCALVHVYTETVYFLLLRVESMY